jgi:hypothetical protein
VRREPPKNGNIFLAGTAIVAPGREGVEVLAGMLETEGEEVAIRPFCGHGRREKKGFAKRRRRC